MPSPLRIDPARFYVAYEGPDRWHLWMPTSFPDKFSAHRLLRQAMSMEDDPEGDADEWNFLNGCIVLTGAELISKGVKTIKERVVSRRLYSILARINQPYPPA